jgi:cysteine sulfinate desulfinase/cysteine desulfurase-like protein
VGTGALSAFGIPEKMRDFAIRISLSHRNTEADIDALLASLQKGVGRLARRR